MNEVATVLHSAAHMIEERGHYKGAGTSFYMTEICPVEAIELIIGDRELRKAEARSALRRFIGSQYIPTWNDHPDTTDTEVILALGFAGCLAEEDS